MDLGSRLVIVADTPALAKDLFTWLAADGYQPTVATTFASAKVHLQTHPQLVISQVKLREYNGLHVALRARHQGIPAVVIGEPDMVLEREAKKFGVTYVKLDDLRRERILALARELIPSACLMWPPPPAAATDDAPDQSQALCDVGTSGHQEDGSRVASRLR
jgi:DNA-binding NtrC family response regulator